MTSNSTVNLSTITMADGRRFNGQATRIGESLSALRHLVEGCGGGSYVELGGGHCQWVIAQREGEGDWLVTTDEGDATRCHSGWRATCELVYHHGGLPDSIVKRWPADGEPVSVCLEHARDEQPEVLRIAATRARRWELVGHAYRIKGRDGLVVAYRDITFGSFKVSLVEDGQAVTKGAPCESIDEALRLARSIALQENG